MTRPESQKLESRLDCVVYSRFESPLPHTHTKQLHSVHSEILSETEKKKRGIWKRYGETKTKINRSLQPLLSDLCKLSLSSGAWPTRLLMERQRKQLFNSMSAAIVVFIGVAHHLHYSYPHLLRLWTIKQKGGLCCISMLIFFLILMSENHCVLLVMMQASNPRPQEAEA